MKAQSLTHSVKNFSKMTTLTKLIALTVLKMITTLTIHDRCQRSQYSGTFTPKIGLTKYIPFKRDELKILSTDLNNPNSFTLDYSTAE